MVGTRGGVWNLLFESIFRIHQKLTECYNSSMQEGQNIGLIKGTEQKYHFKVAAIKPVNVGIEGNKMFATISSYRGEHGRYFLKSVKDETDLGVIVEKYKVLKSRTVKVPRVLKPVSLPNGDLYLLISDLSQEGKLLVVSANNFEIHRPEYKDFVRQLPRETRKLIEYDLIYAGFAAAGIDRRNDSDFSGPRYELGGNAFLAAVDLNNPQTSHIVVGDFGRDIEPSTKSSEELISENLGGAAFFYGALLGGVLQLPKSDKFSFMNQDLENMGTMAVKLAKY